MIYVEQHLLDPKTHMPTGMYLVQFSDLKEFNEFYILAKQDPDVIINILSYDPNKNSGQKSIYDAMLFGMSMENKT